MQDIITELRNRITASVRQNEAKGLLFSGGLDSAVIAGINPRLKAITVNFESPGKDMGYARRLAQHLNIEHHERTVSIDEAIEAVPEVIKILRTFDPAIPNDIVAYFGLKEARSLGIDTVATGDGSDELLAGYSFMRDLGDLEEYIKRISSSLVFSSNELGDFLGIKIKQPYIDGEMVDFCLGLPRELKINNACGKWILRKAFDGLLPHDTLWQSKRPLEYGSGMTKMRGIIAEKVPDGEFEEAKSALLIKFYNKEHFYYYKVYRDIFGDVPKSREGEDVCISCGAGVKKNSFHCKVCGYCK